jgi:hypothetical protein
VVEASLKGVRAKLDRADEHLNALADAIQVFISRDPQPFGISVPYFDPNTNWYTVYAIVEEEPPDRLGVILGDVLHNTRSALDHLVWQLVILDGGIPKGGSRGNAFPISMTEAAWETAKGQHLAGVSEAHRNILEKTQPFKADNPDLSLFGWLRYLSDTDKHQVVHPMASIIHDDPTGAVSFEVTHGPGKVVKEQWQETWFSHGAELLRCKVEPVTPDTEVEMIGDVKLRVAFGERRARETLPKLLMAAAESLVREFAPDFPD